MDVVEAGEAASEYFVAGRRIAGAGEVAAELGEFEEIVAEAGFADSEGCFWHPFRVHFLWSVTGGVARASLNSEGLREQAHRLHAGIPPGSGNENELLAGGFWRSEAGGALVGYCGLRTTRAPLGGETQQGCSVTRTLEACATEGTQPGRTPTKTPGKSAWTASQPRPKRRGSRLALRWEVRCGGWWKIVFGCKFLRGRGLGFLIFKA